MDYAWIVAEIGLGAVGLTVLAALTLKSLSRLTAHTVILLGHRVSDAPAAQDRRVDDVLWFRFAIQNSEDVALTADELGIDHLELRVEIDGPSGRFSPLPHLNPPDQDTNEEVRNCEEAAAPFNGFHSNPRLFAGPHPIPVMPDADHPRTYRVQFRELPAYDTWVIEFTTDLETHSVSLHIDEVVDGVAVKRTLARIHPTTLQLPRSTSMASKGRLKSPGPVFGAVSIAIMCALYLALSAMQSRLPWVWATPLDYVWDGGAAFVLALLGGAMFILSRRPAPMIAQGYLEETSRSSET